MTSKKFWSLLICLAMMLALFAGCAQTTTTTTDETGKTDATDTTTNEGTTATDAGSKGDTLSVGYSPFNSKFSPFFSETAYDQDAWAITQINLVGADRTGAPVLNGIEGETINYNGTDYTYYGPANVVITENDDGTVYYDVTMRDDLVFSDGEPVTIDDVIFTMYVYADPTYDGSTTLFALPIQGMEEYRSGMDTLFNLIAAAGKDNTTFEFWTEEEQTAFWADLEQAGEKFAQEIVDYCAANYETATVAEAAAKWGFTVDENATAADFFAQLCADYEWDLKSMSDTETAGSSLFELMENYDAYSHGVKTGESAANISGIQKTGDYSMRVVLTQVDATAIYQFELPIAPMHYYGDASLYDYDNNSFGFTKGDLSIVRSKTTTPMGAGPYKFLEFTNGIIYYEANETYYKGAPKTKNLQFVQCTTDDDKMNGVVTGTIDITDPTFSADKVEAIEQANGGSITGDVITTNTVDNRGYGYIGMNAKVMKVGEDGSSTESKNLRKAFGTLFAVYRDVAIDSYYGERASVINYPISNTSWAAPRPSDDGYKVAFSTDVNGNDIYTSSMTAEEKYEAAKQAALGFFEAAGYTVENGVLTAAPEGAALEYTFWIPADGTGDHPAFMIVTETKKALETIGMNLIIKDLTNSSELWDALRAQTVAFWAAAWQASVDPDMYQIYFSGDDTHLAGGSNYQYAIDDAELNNLILEGRASTDQTYRKAIYKACLDIIIDWAVEIPTYQRQNAVIFSTQRVNIDTVTPDITTFYGWMEEVENIEMN